MILDYLRKNLNTGTANIFIQLVRPLLKIGNYFLDIKKSMMCQMRFSTNQLIFLDFESFHKKLASLD